MVRLNTPLNTEDILSLKLGEMVFINGIIFTGRYKVHRYLANEKPPISSMPFDLQGGVIYHCGPLLKKHDDNYSVLSAGPSTSSRVDLYQPEVIRTYNIKAIIGKGGMGINTIKAMQECKCIYLNTISGSAVYLANRIKKVIGGYKIDEFSDIEAMWAFEVEDFPAVLTIDTQGNTLHKNIKNLSSVNIINLIQR
ncbi:MAG TPA: fumarate hydrolyase [Nitrospirae bacterium]|nr:fumarate hydrolyase [Nitrospirota bacterium]